MGISNRYCEHCDTLRYITVKAIKETFNIDDIDYTVDADVAFCDICDNKVFVEELDEITLSKLINKKELIRLLETAVQGFKAQGYRERGGSSVYRLMYDPIKEADFKLFLNRYDNPTHIVMRYC